jgi:hypothetical protein
MNELIRETIILNNSAQIQLSTLKPGTISEAHLMISIFITSRKRPKVSTVIGIVNRINIGFIKLFNRPSTAATIMAVTVPLICTPGNRNTAIKMATAVINVFDKKDIIL